jgi:hypothetical protein
MKVDVTYSHDEQMIRGTVEYANGIATVDIGDEVAQGLIEDYLSKTQTFRIPESQQIDDFRIERAKPTDSEMHFSLALCTMYHTIGVWVNWETKEV